MVLISMITIIQSRLLNAVVAASFAETSNAQVVSAYMLWQLNFCLLFFTVIWVYLYEMWHNWIYYVKWIDLVRYQYKYFCTFSLLVVFFPIPLPISFSSVIVLGKSLHFICPSQ